MRYCCWQRTKTCRNAVDVALFIDKPPKSKFRDVGVLVLQYSSSH